MKDLYTNKDLCLYPGFNSVVIRQACEALNIDLSQETRRKRVHGRLVDVFNRAEFEQIMEHHGYELIELKEGKFWVRYKTADI